MSKILNQNIAQTVIITIFNMLGINKLVAASIIKDPNVQKQIKQIQKSMAIISSIGAEWDQINNRYHKL